MSADYDLLIVGAGPAAWPQRWPPRSGARIALVDNPAAGGQIWRDGPRANLPPQAHQMRQRLAGQANVEHFRRPGWSPAVPGRRLLLEDPQRGWQVGYRRLVLCTGARELLLPFPGWTLPGVTGAGGLQALAKGGLPLAGQRLVVAAPAAAAGQRRQRQPVRARLLRVARTGGENRPPSPYASRAGPANCAQAAGLFARSYRADSYVLAALGEERLKPCACAKAVGSARSPANAWPAASAWCPTCNSARPSAIASTARRSPSTNGRPAACPDHYAAGECTGFGGSELALVEGAIAGHAAVDERDAARRLCHDGDAGGASPTPWRDTSPCVPNCANWRRRIPWSAVAKTSPWPRWPGMPAADRGQAAQPLRHGRLPGRICGGAAQFLFGWTPPAPRPPFSPARLETLACWRGDAG